MKYNTFTIPQLTTPNNYRLSDHLNNLAKESGFKLEVTNELIMIKSTNKTNNNKSKKIVVGITLATVVSVDTAIAWINGWNARSVCVE